MKQDSINKIKKAGNIYRYTLGTVMLLGIGYGAYWRYHDYYLPNKKVAELYEEIEKHLDSNDWRVRDGRCYEIEKFPILT